MSQTYTVNSYQADHSGQSDLQNMENNFESIRSSFSGATAPANLVAGHLWFDTSKLILKVRNNANSAWLGVMYGSTAYKVWVYANSAGDGWVLDSSLTDRVIAIKGGSQAYNTNGGAAAGSWTIAAHTHSHTHSFSSGSHVHQWYDSTGVNSTTDNTYNSSGTSISISNTNKQYGKGIEIFTGDIDGGTCLSPDSYTSAVTTSGTTGSDATAGGGITTFRPAAAVGTLQYPNV